MKCVVNKYKVWSPEVVESCLTGQGAWADVVKCDVNKYKVCSPEVVESCLTGQGTWADAVLFKLLPIVLLYQFILLNQIQLFLPLLLLNQ